MLFWCKNCINNSERPRITFDKRGWCNACQWSEEKKRLNWDKRRKELKSILKKYKSNGDYDCIVPVSGGKDGTYVTHKLRDELDYLTLCHYESKNISSELASNNVSFSRGDLGIV